MKSTYIYANYLKYAGDLNLRFSQLNPAIERPI